MHNNSIISTAQYFGANIVLLAISTSLTVIVLNVHHRGSLGNPVPPLVRLVVLDWLAKMLGLRKRIRKHNKKQVSDANTVQVTTLNKHNYIGADYSYADDGFERIFLNENIPISFQNSLKFVRKGPVDNRQAWFR